MTAPTTAEFLDRFPEFRELSTNVVEGALAESGRSVPETVWGEFHPDAISYLTAHSLACRSMQIGLQVGSPSGSPIGQDVQSTFYGQEYKRLLDQLPLTGFAF